MYADRLIDFSFSSRAAKLMYAFIMNLTSWLRLLLRVLDLVLTELENGPSPSREEPAVKSGDTPDSAEVHLNPSGLRSFTRP